MDMTDMTRAAVSRRHFLQLAGAGMLALTGTALTGCDNSTSGEDSDKGSKLAAIKSRGHLNAGVKKDVPGYGYYDTAKGRFEGMEVDLCYQIAAAVFGVSYKEARAQELVEFTDVTPKTRGPLIDNGQLDVVAATYTITDERKKSWDFSTPYYTDAVTVLVEKADGITDLSGLVGKKIGVSTGSTSAYALVKAMTEKGLLGDYALPETSADFDISSFDSNGTSFEQFGDYPAISNAMTAGTIDAFCVDKSILATYKTDDRDYITDTFSPQEYGVATKKDSPLSSKIDELIKGWLEDGTIDGLITEFGLN